eukprot:2979153-Prorocentrum_lima.AAC.1
MTSSLVGSEMCIRDRSSPSKAARREAAPEPVNESKSEVLPGATLTGKPTVSYTHLTLPTICSV